MQRSDYLNPVSMREQCERAVRRMEEDNKALNVVRESIERFVSGRGLRGEGFGALRRHMKDYGVIIEGIKMANMADEEDFKTLRDSVGEEVLDGENIFSQMENALGIRESCRSDEALYREKMRICQDPFTCLYYRQKAEKYGALAEGSQRLYEKWEKKAERFDEIASCTGELFARSKEISRHITDGLSAIEGAFQNGVYTEGKRRAWKRNIENACLRIGRCFRDYGGMQEGPFREWRLGTEESREEIRQVVHSFREYEDYTDEQITDLLEKLNSEGCGYVAFANIVADHFRGREKEFEKAFGFPLFQKNRSGTEQVNYNRLVLDLYCASDNHREEGLIWGKHDVYDPEEDFSRTQGWGTTRESREYRFERYMEAHDVKAEIKNIESSAQDVYQKCREEIEKGNQVIIATHPVILEDSEGKSYQSDGGHAMTVTGLTKDGKITVSSWGSQYYIDPGNPDFQGICPEGECEENARIQIQSVRIH